MHVLFLASLNIAVATLVPQQSLVNTCTMQVSRVFICCMPQVPAVAIKYAKIHITDARFSNFPREKQTVVKGEEEEAATSGCSGLRKGSTVCVGSSLAATCKLSHSSVCTGKKLISLLIPPSLYTSSLTYSPSPPRDHLLLVCSWHSPSSRCAYLGA